MDILGIDVGGTGIKGAPVDTETGELLAERQRYRTPRPATPENFTRVLREMVSHFRWKGEIGIGFPGVIRNQVVESTGNLALSWPGTPIVDLFSKATECSVSVINDADAAGLAEMKFGAGRRAGGTVLVITIGTGLGSALFFNGILFPNTEFGHLHINGRIAEQWAAASARKNETLSWEVWAARLNRYLKMMERVLTPDLIILGGGISKKHEKFLWALDLRTPVVPAHLYNVAGIAGAALFAATAPGGNACARAEKGLERTALSVN
ncbi:MAG: ROK family protein [Opitutales bacterium]